MRAETGVPRGALCFVVYCLRLLSAQQYKNATRHVQKTINLRTAKSGLAQQRQSNNNDSYHSSRGSEGSAREKNREKDAERKKKGIERRKPTEEI